jgi:hypothetical protein
MLLQASARLAAASDTDISNGVVLARFMKADISNGVVLARFMKAESPKSVLVTTAGSCTAWSTTTPPGAPSRWLESERSMLATSCSLVLPGKVSARVLLSASAAASTISAARWRLQGAEHSPHSASFVSENIWIQHVAQMMCWH